MFKFYMSFLDSLKKSKNLIWNLTLEMHIFIKNGWANGLVGGECNDKQTWLLAQVEKLPSPKPKIN